jgi:ubiquinone/menaquinone biosynthesis C-methylase UbiE
MSFSLRDSQFKAKVINEVEKTLRTYGKFLIIDIGKPNNKTLKSLFSLYLKYLVPLTGGLLTGRGIRNQWSLLYKTYQELPQNRSLEEYLKDIFYSVYLQEFVFGGLVIVLAMNKMDKKKQ